MCSKIVSQIILFLFNLLFFVGGALLLAFGIVGVASPTTLTNFLSSIPGVTGASTIVNIPSLIVSSSIFMIILGGVMLVFGFLGFCGVVCVQQWMLFLYIVLVIAVLLAEIALIIYAALQPAKFESQVRDIMYKSLKDKFQPMSFNNTGNYFMMPPDPIASAWVSMQIEVQCCGTYNASDYQSFTWNNTFTMGGVTFQAVVPPSCCHISGSAVGKKPVPPPYASFDNLQDCLQGTTTGLWYTSGCDMAVHQLLVQYSYVAIIICAVVIGIELIAIMAACFLRRTIKSAEKAV